MSIDLTAWAWREIRTAELEPVESLVLLALADLAPVGDEDGRRVIRGLEPNTVAEACGIPAGRARATMETLHLRGLVTLA